MLLERMASYYLPYVLVFMYYSVHLAKARILFYIFTFLHAQ